MAFKLNLISALVFVFCLNTSFGQAEGTDKTFFAHITYYDGSDGPNNHFLLWFTEKYIPNTYFVVEHLSWGKWVKRRKINENSPLGKREYFSKSGVNVNTDLKFLLTAVKTE